MLAISANQTFSTPLQGNLDQSMSPHPDRHTGVGIKALRRTHHSLLWQIVCRTMLSPSRTTKTAGSSSLLTAIPASLFAICAQSIPHDLSGFVGRACWSGALS